jgi:hypothetical protein
VQFADDGRAVVAAGDLTDAWRPSCADDGCSKRAVERALRTLVFVRPRALVIDDRLTLTDGNSRASWAAHTTVAPDVQGSRASARVGASRVDLVTLEPAGAVATARKEPTPTGDGPYRANVPWGPMWRLEVASPAGAPARRFLHVVAAAAAAEAPPEVTRIQGAGLDGARVGESAVLFTDEGGTTTLPQPTSDALVVALDPQTRLTGEADGCRLSVRRDARGSSPLRIATPHCRR